MRILGIDPGLAVTGYGIIDERRGCFKLIEAGIIKTSARGDLGQRLNKIYNSLTGLIEETRPDVLVLEKLYTHYRHPTTACLLGHARGIVCLAAKKKKINFFEYSTTRINKAILGRGNASKYQIQRMVSHLLNLNQLPNAFDITDALALAIAYTFISKVNI